jgi:hypothetical protein
MSDELEVLSRNLLPLLREATAKRRPLARTGSER